MFPPRLAVQGPYQSLQHYVIGTKSMTAIANHSLFKPSVLSAFVPRISKRATQTIHKPVASFVLKYVVAYTRCVYLNWARVGCQNSADVELKHVT